MSNWQTDFDEAREAFEASVRRAPDAALRYTAPGEDYAAGGLVVHVTDVLRRYALLADALRQADFGALAAPAYATPDEDAALIHAGFDGATRGAVLDDMRAAHAALVDALLSSPADLERQAAVTYEGSAEPYPTSLLNIAGWVTDHYREHTLHIADLVSAWADSSR